MDITMVDVTSKGHWLIKHLNKHINLFPTWLLTLHSLATNLTLFPTIRVNQINVINANNQRIENRLNKLTFMVRHIAIGQVQFFTIISLNAHAIDLCAIL